LTALRPTHAEIDLANLNHNFQLIRTCVGSIKIMATVKAEAYGHGLIQVSKSLESKGADYLAVSFLEEGIRLREAGIKLPILVMGGLVDEQIDLYIDFHIDITVSSIWKAKQVERVAKLRSATAKVHLKFDTGMGRIGQNWKTADKLIAESAKLKNTEIIGIYTHLASADDPDLNFCHTQINRFEELIESARAAGINPPLIHAANSGAILQHGAKTRFTMVRPGLLLYGWAPSLHLEGALPLKPIMTLKSKVVFVKKPPAGSTIGYGSSWTSPGDRWIATVPIGYGDGYPLRAGNKSEVLLDGRLCRVVGKVSMDQITVDADQQAYLGDEVILFGGEGKNQLSIWKLCQSADTIPYALLCGLTQRVPRRYLNDENGE